MGILEGENQIDSARELLQDRSRGFFRPFASTLRDFKILAGAAAIVSITGLALIFGRPVSASSQKFEVHLPIVQKEASTIMYCADSSITVLVRARNKITGQVITLPNPCAPLPPPESDWEKFYGELLPTLP